MYNTLLELKNESKEAAFLFPAFPHRVIGKIQALEDDRVFINFSHDGNNYQVILHPDAVVIIQQL